MKKIKIPEQNYIARVKILRNKKDKYLLQFVLKDAYIKIDDPELVFDQNIHFFNEKNLIETVEQYFNCKYYDKINVMDHFYEYIFSYN